MENKALDLEHLTEKYRNNKISWGEFISNVEGALCSSRYEKHSKGIFSRQTEHNLDVIDLRGPIMYFQANPNDKDQLLNIVKTKSYIDYLSSILGFSIPMAYIISFSYGLANIAERHPKIVIPLVPLSVFGGIAGLILLRSVLDNRLGPLFSKWKIGELEKKVQSFIKETAIGEEAIAKAL